MAAGRQDIEIDQGAGFVLNAYYRQPDGVTPVDMSGPPPWTAAAQYRKHPTSPDILATFATAVDTTLGRITVTLEEEVTSALDGGTGAWDLFLFPPEPAEPIMLLRGSVTVERRVTR